MDLKTVSNSSLSCYAECPLKFYYLYVRKIQPQTKAIALAVGGSTHKVLAEQYTLLKTDKVLTIEDARQIFKQALEKEPIDYKDSTLEATVLGCDQMLNTIVTHPLPVKPKKVENFFETDFVNPLTREKLKPRLKGIIDLIAEEDIIVEHKTSTAKYKDTNITDSFQHVGYYISYVQMYKKKPSKILYHVIYKNSKAVPEIFDVKIFDKDISCYFEWAKNIIESIKEDDWEPNPTYKCRWCDYSDLCSSSK